jgi:hypothetical protein
VLCAKRKNKGGAFYGVCPYQYRKTPMWPVEILALRKIAEARFEGGRAWKRASPRLSPVIVCE